LAEAGHRVIGLDGDARTVADLQLGQPPLFEPGLEDLLKKGLAQRCLTFTTDIASAVGEADAIWIAYDTPVDDEDRADVNFVVSRATLLFPHLRKDTLVIISSQLPVGTTRRLEDICAAICSGKRIAFVCSPENLRLGKAINVFMNPDRVVAGTRCEEDLRRFAELMLPITDRIEAMSVESAEMVKHAINAFLAVSVTFINEVASLCERCGADAGEVSVGLKTDSRIGPRAYLKAGAAFAGGTLARDIVFLEGLGEREGLDAQIFSAVRRSNEEHRSWLGRRLMEVLGSVTDRRIGVLGLTYKPGTDTLRRSTAVELCRWLTRNGAVVSAFDPVVREVPEDLRSVIGLFDSPDGAMRGTQALLIMTECPQFRSITADDVCRAMPVPLVLDSGGFLEKQLGCDSRIRYLKVGKS
jgi:UDPglucose 6-dehydrogenase